MGTVHWVWLWSDMIFWALLSVVMLLLILPKQRYITEAWYYVGTSKIAVSSGVILLFFIIVTGLDSLHFQNNAAQDRVQSLLDVSLSPLNQNMETTYSRPFARHEFIPSPVIGKSGHVELIDAPLKYLDPDIVSGQKSMTWDIVKRIGLGILSGALVWGILFGIICLFIPLRACMTKTRHHFQWPTLLATMGSVCVVVGVLWSLSRGYHILGTDKVGEDVFYQGLKGIRTGMLIGTLTTLILLPVSLFFGMIAGFFGKWVDDVVQYVYTVLNAIPTVLLIAASVLILEIVIDRNAAYFVSIDMRADLRLLALCAILGVTSWTSLCRLIRGETLKLREQDYVKASVALGVRPLGILKRHILPNLMHIIFITITLDFSGLVLAEAVLSYVGVGVDPSTYSWGNMINAARQELARDPIVWWSLASAFIFMLSLVLPANLFADMVQKAFDPRGRQVSDE